LTNDQELADLHITLSAISEQYLQHMDALAQNLAAMFQPMQNQLSAMGAAISSSVQPPWVST
jgi:hypothetical protein